MKKTGGEKWVFKKAFQMYKKIKPFAHFANGSHGKDLQGQNIAQNRLWEEVENFH